MSSQTKKSSAPQVPCPAESVLVHTEGCVLVCMAGRDKAGETAQSDTAHIPDLRLEIGDSLSVSLDTQTDTLLHIATGISEHSDMEQETEVRVLGVER